MSSIAITASKVAEIISGDLFISSPELFTGINSLSEAEPEEISFLGNKKYHADFLKTRSRLVISSPLLQEAPDGIGIIHVENPTLAFSQVIDYFRQKQKEVEYTVSKDAIISPTAQISDGVAIMPGAIIGDHVRIGKGTIIHSGAVLSQYVTVAEDTIIYQNVTVRENSVIGSRVRLQPGAVIGADGYGYEQVDGKHVKIPQVGSVIIEDDVEVGANTCIDRARFGKTIIGQGTKIDNLVQVGHNVRIGPHNLLVSQCGISGSTTTENHVIIGPQAGVTGHITLGTGVIVGGQSGLAKTTHTPGIYQGTPARPVGQSRRSKALTNRLPKMLDRIKELEKKIEELEKKQG